MRFTRMIIGISFIGFSVFLLRLANFGTDPFTTMNLGISSFLDISFGSFQLSMNGVMLIVVAKIASNHIGLGTLANMILVGYISDFFIIKFTAFFSGPIQLPIRVFLLIFGMLLMSFGVALYILSELGAAPYDALPSIIEAKTNKRISFQNSRIIMDFFTVIVGFSFGATVGVGTIFTAVFMGPFIQFFKHKLELFNIKK